MPRSAFRFIACCWLAEVTRANRAHSDKLTLRRSAAALSASRSACLSLTWIVASSDSPSSFGGLPGFLFFSFMGILSHENISVSRKTLEALGVPVIQELHESDDALLLKCPHQSIELLASGLEIGADLSNRLQDLGSAHILDPHACGCLASKA